MTFKSKLVTQYILKQCPASAGRFSIYPVVSPHDSLNLCILYTSLEGIQICIIHIML